MSTRQEIAKSVYRDYEIDGDPSSGPHSPVMSEIRAYEARKNAAIDRALVAQVGSTIAVESRTISTPPERPTVGDHYIVGPSPAGAWTGKANQIATATESGWDFVIPANVCAVLVLDEFEIYGWNTLDTAWEAITSGPLTRKTLAELNSIAGVPANIEAHVRADVIAKTVSRARASNVATLVFAGYHGQKVGDQVNLRFIGGVGYNGRVTVASAPDAMTITYTSVDADESTTTDLGGQIDRNGVYRSNGGDLPPWEFVSDLDVDILRAQIAATASMKQTSLDQWRIHEMGDETARESGAYITTDDVSYVSSSLTANDDVAVPSIAVCDHDWRQLPRGDRAQRFRLEKGVTRAVDSISGSDANAGTLYAPKQTLAAVGASLGAGDVLGLYRGGSWREKLPTKNLYTPPGVEVQDIAFGSANALPKVSAFDPVPDGAWVNNGDGTYSYSWTPSDTLVDNGYDEVFAIRRDKMIAASKPISCEERLTKVATAASCVATADTYYTSCAGGTWTIRIHPLDGAAPGTRYTYEVIARYNNADWTNYSRDGVMQGLHLSGACMGYGMIQGPGNFVGDRLILTHGNSHSAVIQGGIIQRTLFYGKGNATHVPIVFYAANATGRRGVFRDSYVIGAVASGFLTHNSGGDAQAWEYARIENVAFVGGGRQANGALVGAGFAGYNVKKILFRRLFVKGYATGGAPDPTPSVNTEVTDCIFLQVGYQRSANLYRGNISYHENLANPTSASSRGVRCMEIAAFHAVEKNIFHARYVDQGNGVADSTAQVLTGTNGAPIPNNVVFSKNIIIFGAGLVHCYVVNGLTRGFSHVAIDYNVYIHVSGMIQAYGTQFTQPYPQTFAEYLAQNGGLDAHSLYIDLRDDPRGAKAVFMNPDNGDFRFAQTAVAKQVADYCIANSVGPAQVISHWPSIPSADDIALMIQSL